MKPVVATKEAPAGVVDEAAAVEEAVHTQAEAAAITATALHGKTAVVTTTCITTVIAVAVVGHVMMAVTMVAGDAARVAAQTAEAGETAVAVAAAAVAAVVATVVDVVDTAMATAGARTAGAWTASGRTARGLATGRSRRTTRIASRLSRLARLASRLPSARRQPMLCGPLCPLAWAQSASVLWVWWAERARWLSAALGQSTARALAPAAGKLSRLAVMRRLLRRQAMQTVG